METSALVSNAEERFWSHVDRSGGPDACWPWTGAVTKGYGQFAVARDAHTAAHRFAYELVHGSIQEGMVICHACDNRPCVNTNHLFVGTQADNIHDAMAKGRFKAPPVLAGDANPTRIDGSWVRGARNPHARLDESDVVSVRERIARGESQSSIARSLGVRPGAINKIHRGRTWRMV